ncbi:RNA polymerase sigma factor [Myxococcota bacterium]|nr:RNA polymerase sigma factor [Myxococcota bacterium]
MEQQILSMMREGHRERALELMARAWAQPIGRFCCALAGSAAEGEDLLQETFIEAWRAMETFRAESSPRAWLYGIARNLCASHLRRRDRRRSLFGRFFADSSAENAHCRSSEDNAVRSEEQVLLDAALADLKPALREAVLLHYQGHFSMQEIADMLEISPANARKRVSLGVGALREALRPVLMKPENPRGGQDENEQSESVSGNQGPRVVRS